jgi:hypothetical protein
MIESGKSIYSLLADLVLVVHFGFVAFVVLGFVLIWAGYFGQWSFVRRIPFRLAHLLAMGFVLAESLTGFICPLTTWEHQLRLKAGHGTGYEGSFIQYWFGRLLFHDWSEGTFTILYTAFFLLVLLTFGVVRPRWRRNQRD